MGETIQVHKVWDHANVFINMKVLVRIVSQKSDTAVTASLWLMA